MATPGEAFGDNNNNHRICARRGCTALVKKRTAKYCSVQCCTVDPERRERIRVQSRKAHLRPLPLVHQLSFALHRPTFDPEAGLAEVSAMREDVPGGMSRLAG
jgi:hypothetical protein